MMKTKTMKLMALLLTAMVSVFAFTGCFWLFEKEAELKEVQQPKLFAVYDEECKMYDVYVEGVIENASNFEIYANVTVVLYDQEGNILETAYASISDMGAGEKWHYCATTSSLIEPSSCRLSEMSGWKENY